MREASLEFLQTLLNTPSPPGHEARGQRVWLNYVSPYADESFSDAYGNAVAVWLQFYGFGRFQVWANRYNAALGAWGIPQAIQEGEADSLAPQAALDASGNAMVVWYQDNGAYTYTIMANHYRARLGNWSGPQVIQAGVDDAAYPQVARDASGNE